MMQFLSARHMFMHCMFFFLLSFVLKFLFCFYSSLSLSFVLLIMAPKKAIPSKNLIRDEMTQDDFSENFLTGQFIQNARSFYLIFQTLLYLVHLAFGDGLLFVKNLHGVPTCSYRSFTPTCMSSIPLYLGLLWYSKVHAS